MPVRPRAIFFDWDGTLVDTLPFLHKAHNHVRETMGFERWSVKEFKGHVRYSSRELYASLYGLRAKEALDILGVYMEQNHIRQLHVLDDAFALIDCLKQHDVPTGIVSNKRHEFLLREIGHLNWDSHFASVVGAGVAARDKPAADPLLMALSQAGIPTGPDIWYVGDSEPDMRTAQAAGCSAILIRHHHDNAALVREFEPLHAFDNCAAMIDFVNKSTALPVLTKNG